MGFITNGQYIKLSVNSYFALCMNNYKFFGIKMTLDLDLVKIMMPDKI